MRDKDPFFKGGKTHDNIQILLFCLYSCGKKRARKKAGSVV